MALVVRTSVDTVSLPDHGFVGKEGALRVLMQTTQQTRRLDLSHNLLGTDGVLTLLQGLASKRRRLSGADTGTGGGGAGSMGMGMGELWGLRELNLALNGMGDAGFEGVLGYAKKDVLLQRLYLQGNEIELKGNIQGIIHSLNSSHISLLSLNHNRPAPSSLSTFFDTLSAPNLTSLHLSTCDIPPDIAGPIAAFLVSPRARNLVDLGLNANRLGLSGVREIIDAVERANYTILQLGLSANDSQSARIDSDDEAEVDGEIDAEAVQRQRQRESAALSFEVTQRLPPLLERNRTLTTRVQRAAAKCIAPTRILLNALPPPEADPTDVARQVIADVASGAGTPPSRFRLLDLPPEVLYLVVRHASGDAAALSDAQFARIRHEAEDRAALGRLGGVMRARVEQARWGGLVEMRRARGEVRDEWLRRGRWDKWELDAGG